MIDKPKRDISAIESELQTALKRETSNIIAIGDLLLEAKEQLVRGRWLPWLKSNFGSSERTAYNYMNAARFASKFAIVANLKLKPTALYLLGNDMDIIPLDEMEVIFKVAETEWVDYERVWEIINSIHLERSRGRQQIGAEELQRAMDERHRAAEAERSEADDILDGPPPELPPAEEATPVDPNLMLFNESVEALAKLYTKQIATFVTTTHEPGKLRAIAEFLQDVANAAEQQKAATGATPLLPSP